MLPISANTGDEPDETGMIAGWLWKQSRHLHVFRRRYCVVDGPAIRFFREADDKSPTEVVELTGMRWRLTEAPGSCCKQKFEGRRPSNVGPALATFALDVECGSPTFADFLYKKRLVCAVETRQLRRWVQRLASSEYPPAAVVRCREEALDFEVLEHASGTGDCGICLETLGENSAVKVVRLGACGHAFCRPCLDQWAAVKRLCPICKAIF